jgi:hypothetical protein
MIPLITRSVFEKRIDFFSSTSSSPLAYLFPCLSRFRFPLFFLWLALLHCLSHSVLTFLRRRRMLLDYQCTQHICRQGDRSTSPQPKEFLSLDSLFSIQAINNKKPISSLSKQIHISQLRSITTTSLATSSVDTTDATFSRDAL